MGNELRDLAAAPSRWSRAAHALTLFLVLTLLLAAFAPDPGEAKPKRNRDQVHGEIVGGTPVARGQLPFMALVIMQGRFLCGGTLVASDYVLTAAHCVESPETGNLFQPRDFRLFIGIDNINDAKSSNTFGVSAVFQYPGWDDFTRENDVAVLRLSRDVPTDIGAPVSLVGSGNTTYDAPGFGVVTAGWGRTSTDGDTSSQLLETSLNVVSDAGCDAAYDEDFFPAVMICAAAPGRDSCQGDSGGPLFVKQQTGTTSYVKKGKKKKHHKRKKTTITVPVFQSRQMGIVSWGGACADPNEPGVYTRLSNPAINAFITGTIGQ